LIGMKDAEQRNGAFQPRELRRSCIGVEQRRGGVEVRHSPRTLGFGELPPGGEITTDPYCLAALYRPVRSRNGWPKVAKHASFGSGAEQDSHVSDVLPYRIAGC
jgi:hypothetical protein